MPDIRLSFPYRLSQDEAGSRVKRLLGGLQDRYGKRLRYLREEWKGNSCSFSFQVSGFRVSGTITTTPKSVDLTGKLPWAAAVFKSQIEDAIRRRAETLLA